MTATREWAPADKRDVWGVSDFTILNITVSLL